MEFPATSKLAPGAVAAEQRARDFLAKSQWRKAREELKPLTKIDRPRYLPLLIQANLGLSREMIAKGQISEAQQVLAYLATIASPDQLRGVELELTSKSDPSASGLEKIVSALAEQAVPLPEVDKLRLADRAVLFFQPVSGGEPAHERLAAELRAIHDALLSSSMQQWDRLPDILRCVPHRSVFAHWSVFIKGMAAFHTGDADRAARCWANLPPKTVPATAALSFLLLAPKTTPLSECHPPSELALEGACRLLGFSGVGGPFLAADRLWKERKHAASYRKVRDAVPEFPTQHLNWIGALSDFYFNASQTLAEGDREKYVDYFDELLALRNTRNLVEEMQIHRLLALSRGARFNWEGFLRAHEQLHRPNPRFASMVYAHLGASLAQPSSMYRFMGRSESVNARGARECMEKAIALNPGHLEAHLALVRLYTSAKMASERNRLLDRMVEQFPDEKRVLLDAAQGCIDRKAFVKGLDYLDRAQKLDQLDPKIPELTVLAQHRLALQHFRQKRPDKGREDFASVELLSTEKPDDFHRSRWTLQVRQGLLEHYWGDAAQAQALLDEARVRAPSPAVFLFFAHLVCRTDGPGPDMTSLFWFELKATVKTAQTLDQVLLLLRLLEHGRQGSPGEDFDEEESVLRRSLKPACGRAFTREQARQVVELKRSDPGWSDELRVLIKKVLRADKADPLFRLYELLVGTELDYRPTQARFKLEEILKEAARRGDEPTTQKARQALQRLESRPMPFPPMPFRPDFDDDEPEDIDDLEFGEPPDLEGLLQEMAPEAAAEFALLMKDLAHLPESELRKARERRPKEIPAALFDLLVEMARKGKPPDPPAPATLPNPGKKPIGPTPAPRLPEQDDRNQLDLF